ncbi:hypothetical protein J5N97_002264 [Dioscorea zingiberensis]|uniref:Protein kinase domain-containing protein n=1 Tax=Dioscorea zingiberensis TaxID=325984 RepID=A0A9D5D2I6_9LILI|nr:hypothetical protein J5N97_002264 [Dioscorea zingiberensis]
MAESPRLREVLEFLNARGFSRAAAALHDDVLARGCDLDVSRPPPVRITPENRAASSSSSSGDAFVSMGSSPSEFLNPCALWSPARAGSEDSSGRLSEFQTARDYHGVNPFSDTHWYDDQFEYHLSDSHFLTMSSAAWNGEDKFVMAIEAEEQFRRENDVSVCDKNDHDVDVKCEGCTEVYSCPFPICDCCSGLKKQHDAKRMRNPDSTVYERYLIMDDQTERLEECGVTEYQLKRVDGPPEAVHLVEDSVHDLKLGEKKSLEPGNDPTSYRKDIISSNYVVGGCLTRMDHDELQSEGVDLRNVNGKPHQPVGDNAFDMIGYGTMNGEFKDPETVVVGDKDHGAVDELSAYNSLEDEYEIFNLRIVHRKNRTGFEESKDMPIVLNSVIGGRYYVTEYLGSAAFSKVVQAHDLQMGVDVCLKIIKNDKDFFDQSLDEIKLLKYVNKNDPGDKRHLLRLYDYFYHQEHLFIVCELLRANLYEFQKYNLDSGGEVYFTLPRIQAIARQCLEALEYLHQLRIIHCDLKPENILIKSYSKCEIKVIDLGSSCFLTDNLCLYVQSRSYRAPEIILGHSSYDQRIDLWSLGCILAELYSGDVLFTNDSVVMMLARMIGILGPIDMEMLTMGLDTDRYFTDDYDLYYRNEETDQIEYLIPEKSTLARELQVSDMLFLDFLEHVLQINPKRRPTAKQALQHPWLSFSYH